METAPGFSLSAAAAARVAALSASRGGAPLRVSVSGGGCSGFRYGFELDECGALGDDVSVSRDGATVVVDPASMELLAGAELVWEESLMGSRIGVRNPGATSSCGCGASFSVD